MARSLIGLSEGILDKVKIGKCVASKANYMSNNSEGFYNTLRLKNYFFNNEKTQRALNVHNIHKAYKVPHIHDILNMHKYYEELNIYKALKRHTLALPILVSYVPCQIKFIPG